MKAGTLNQLDSDFKMKGFWKFVNSDTIFFSSLDRDFKTNLDTEYLKFLENLKCKLGNKKLWCDQNQTLPPPKQKLIGHGWGTGYMRGSRGE